ncbi:MAG: OadG family protein [Halanaerobiales bacterium]|nr:OadG family protein [Halanaerobiales bacterium]
MNPLELLKDPSLVQSMTISEKLISGLMVAILGMVIVFMILFLLLLVLNILKKLFYSEKMIFKEDGKKMVKSAPDIKLNDDKKKEKVAAIIAAINSIDSFSKKDKYKIKQIKRVNDDVPIWGKVARGGKITENNKGELL